MKSAVAITSKIHLNLNLRRNHLYSPLSRSIFLGKAKPVFQSPPLIRTHSSNPNPNPIMASSSKPEQARAPPALPLPTPPVAKAISHFAYFLNLDDCYLCSVVALFKVGLCQLSVTADKERNIAHARRAIEEAAEKGAKLILLPEIWNSPYSHDSFPVYAEDIDAGGDASPSTAMLSEVARLLKITIVGGSIPERSGDRLYNTCCVFGSDGKLIAKHRKIHLFDIDIPGKITFIESKSLTAGETPTIVDTDVGRIGIGICYDIRFQELAMIYGARGAHLICYPGAFNMTTGPLHWELLQRARATDNQLYVATCSPARDEGAGYVAWGHSTLVGPFGEVLATTEHAEDIIIAEIDYSILELRSPVAQKSGKMLIHLYSPSNQVPTQNPGQAFHYQSKGEVIFTSWLTFKGLTLSDSCAEY
uniref:Carbon-nitrogen hydrolase family protein n=1 Tax=Citrus unshiu TaxID=55188 RepID=F8WLA8_CITUN|nr:carbon-nitrogen hydrolase family protein [Citrus unshiu]